MISPLQTSIIRADGTNRYVIIEPVLEKDAENKLRPTGVYKLYKDAFGDETILFTEPKEIGKSNDDLADESNPDFLGRFTITNNSNCTYEGDLLNPEEQRQLAEFIRHNPTG